MVHRELQRRPDQEQLRITSNSFHPSGDFVEFASGDVEQSIPQCFERIARIHPERLALKNGNIFYTYDSLNKAANRLAQILLESSRESVAFLSAPTHGILAILAILKAGKSYVGLHPLAPNESNAFYLRDADTDLLVTDDEHYAAALALARDGLTIINLDALEPGNAANPDVDISPETVAGIFYTSGSTGPPKGVIHSHRSILHDVLIRVNNWHFCRDDRFALTQSLSFSGSIRIVFPALLVGAALFPYDMRENRVTDFGRWVDKERITSVFIRRQLLGEFAALRGTGCTFSHLRWLHLGGELIYRSDTETFQKHMPDGCVLSIMYASTEAGCITRYLVDKWLVVEQSDCAPVGYPCDDTEVCVVDNNGNAVGAGEVGEIIVKSCYLSPGYRHQPDLTNCVFSTEPGNSQRRIYRTGDLGHFSQKGCLFHLGRNDSQVKIRGYRVEMTAIEHVLLKHPSIQQAVVKSFTEAKGDIRLVGYVVAVDGKNPTVSELRRHLGTRLADYMIPSKFVLLEALPTTINDKVARNALPEPDRARPPLDQPYCPPDTRLERTLAQIWGNLLHLDRVGIHDNFFELGGHSLLATQLANRLQESLQVAIPVKDIFESSTIGRLAKLIDTMNWLAAEPRAVDLEGPETETF